MKPTTDELINIYLLTKDSKLHHWLRGRLDVLEEWDSHKSIDQIKVEIRKIKEALK